MFCNFFCILKTDWDVRELRIERVRLDPLKATPTGVCFLAEEKESKICQKEISPIPPIAVANLTGATCVHQNWQRQIRFVNSLQITLEPKPVLPVRRDFWQERPKTKIKR